MLRQLSESVAERSHDPFFYYCSERSEMISIISTKERLHSSKQIFGPDAKCDLSIVRVFVCYEVIAGR
jgi:hypothetical protein